MSNNLLPPPPAGNILVAEDNLLNQKIIKSILQKEGYAISTVANGKEALLALERQPYFALILDYQMPELDGFQALQAIRAHAEEHIRKIPVIFLTGELNPETLEQIQVQGISQLLAKPLNPEKLVAAVNQLLSQTAPPGQNEHQPDTSYLYAITEGNRELMAELIAIFMEEAPNAIRQMKTHLKTNNFPALLKAIHKIRSNYKYVGIPEGEKLLGNLETDVMQNQNQDNYEQRIQEIENLTQAFLETLAREKQQLQRK